MRYILTITQKPGHENTDGDFVYKKNKSHFAQKISVTCNYYNLTIRVVNLAGDQLAIYDAFHEPDKFIDHFVFCSNQTQNRRMKPNGARTNESSTVKSSGFLIGITNDQLRTQIQCTGNQWTQRPAMVVQNYKLTEEKATTFVGTVLSEQKDTLAKSGWSTQILKPLQMVTPGKEPPFEELPLDLVDCKDGRIHQAGKLVAIFDARSPESPGWSGTFSDEAANNAMIDCRTTAISHTTATCERKKTKEAAKLSGDRNHQIESSEYFTKAYHWDEISRLTDEEYADAFDRMHQSYREDGYVPNLVERRAFYTRGLQFFNSKDQEKFLMSSPLFANLTVVERAPDRFSDVKHRGHLPTRVGFNYPHEGAFVTTQTESGYRHGFMPPDNIKILLPRAYLAALQGRAVSIQDYPEPQQTSRPITSMRDMRIAAKRSRAEAAKKAAANVATAPATAPVMVPYQTAGEPSGFDVIEVVPPKVTTENKLTAQEEAGLSDLLELDLENLVEVVPQPPSLATPPATSLTTPTASPAPATPGIIPVLSPKGISLTMGTIDRVDVADDIPNQIGIFNADHEMDLYELENELQWLEMLEPPVKNGRFDNLSLLEEQL